MLNIGVLGRESQYLEIYLFITQLPTLPHFQLDHYTDRDRDRRSNTGNGMKVRIPAITED